MEKSDSIKELATALCAAQKEIESAKKDSVNPFFRSKYADFSSVWETCRVPLTKHGLSVSQLPLHKDNLFGVRTILMHTSGEWISEELLLPATKQDPQAAGSAITYARRYSLSGIVCLATEEDDDGNKGSEPEKFITTEQIKSLREKLVTLDRPEDAFCSYLKIESLDKLPAKRFNAAKTVLKDSIKAIKNKKKDPVAKAEDDLKALIANKNKELGVDEPGANG